MTTDRGEKSLSGFFENQVSELALSFSERVDLDMVNDEKIRELISKERVVPVTVGIDNSLRPKILDSCGMTCVFCHNEGTPVASAVETATLLPLPTYNGGRVSVFQETNGVNFIPGKMQPDESFAAALSALKESISARELHLTGGEPSLHRNLPEIVGLAKSLGYSVKMTSNGEGGGYNIAACAEAGLDKINFSIFGTTPEELAAVQHEKYANINRAQVKLNALYRSIEAAIEYGIKVDANIVMSDFEHAERVARIIDKYGDKVSIRILNDLDRGDESYLGIYKLLAALDAEPIELHVEAGTSNSRVKYRLPDGIYIYFKQIRRTTLPETCGSCNLNNDKDCSEGYYGVRLYIDTTGQYKVGVCLQRMDLTENIDEFLASDLPEEIRTLRAKEYSLLKARYHERIKD